MKQVIMKLLVATMMTVYAYAQTQCVAPANVVYSAQNSKVYFNNVPIDIKGVAWFGFEGPGWTIEGLGSASADSILAFLQKNGFNAIRMPFSADMVIADRYPTGYINYNLNPDMQGLTAVQVMALIIDKAASRGIMVLPDMHRFDPCCANLPYWYSVGCITNANGVCFDYTETVVTNMWIKLINVLKNKWNVMGMDLVNEVHEYNSTYDGSTWGQGIASDWNTAAVRIANNIYSATGWTRGLTFVEGIGDTPSNDFCESRNYGHWWGGNLEPVRCTPLPVDSTRYVYSPHVYGPSVFEQPYFSRSDFPDNMPMIWQTDFGFIPGYLNKPVVIGEWGGPVSGSNQVWQEALINYLVSTNIRDTFYWALNPTPGGADTVGVLNGDWATGNQPVLNELYRVQPSPSVFSVSNSQVCITSYANAPIVQLQSVYDTSVAIGATQFNSQTNAGTPILVTEYRLFNATASSFRVLPSNQYENILTGMVMSINPGMGQGSSVVLLPFSSSSTSQQFTRTAAGSLVSVANPSLVVDLRGWSSAIGNVVDVWTSNGQANQQFNMIPVDYSQGRAVSGINYFIINRANGYALDINNENFNSGTVVDVYTRKERYNTANQNWIFTTAGEIQVAAYPNLVLDAAGNGSGRVTIYTRNGGPNQKWIYNRTTGQIINQRYGTPLTFLASTSAATVINPSNAADSSQQWWFLAYSSEF